MNSGFFECYCKDGQDVELTLLFRHGRDNKLNVWQIKPSDEDTFSSILPAEGESTERRQPWLLHSLFVNALNFCAFSICAELVVVEEVDEREDRVNDQALLAVPGTKDTEINIFQLPSENRVHIVPALPFHTGVSLRQDLYSVRTIKLAYQSTGMIMALAIFYDGQDLCVAAGYEGGHSALHRYSATKSVWATLSITQSHTQPILSLALCLPQRCYFTSGADDVLCRHHLPSAQSGTSNVVSEVPATEPVTSTRTKHAGQQSLGIRSDARILATAGWDSRVRVYSAKTLKELAVLKWHKEGCYAIAFAAIQDSDDPVNGTGVKPAGTSVTTARYRRGQRAKEAHWLAAGSKDGKISLWDIY